MPSLKDWIESNPLAVIAGVVIATAGVTATVVGFALTQRKEAAVESLTAKIVKLEGDLASIPRGVQGKDSLDVRRLVSAPGNLKDVPPTAAFFPAHGVYADTAAPFWRRYSVSEGDFIDTLLKESRRGWTEAAAKALSAQLLIWRSPNETAIEGHPIFDRVFPWVGVQGFAKESLRATSAAVGEALAEEEGEAVDTSFATLMMSVMERDLVGAVFAAQMRGVLSTNVGGLQMHTSLQSIEKARNVLYARLLTVLDDVKVGSDPPGRYYVWKEIMVIEGDKRLYIVQTSLPSPDPAARGPAFAAVTQWLKDLRIVDDP